MRIDVLTTFPELFAAEPPALLGVSIPARAIRGTPESGPALRVVATDVRAFTRDRHQKTDDRPFGGGPGMVMMCQPLWDAVHAVEATAGVEHGRASPPMRIVLSPQGVRLTQPLVERFAAMERLTLICGHYEGIDERVIEALGASEVSIGDYVVSGGEVAALVLIDAVARLLPGVLGHADSAGQDSFGLLAATTPNGDPIPERTVDLWLEELLTELDAGAGPTGGSDAVARLLDCPHYTRPREWQGRAIPEVLVSGDHLAVARWRLRQRVERTAARRPDLLRAFIDAGRTQG